MIKIFLKNILTRFDFFDMSAAAGLACIFAGTCMSCGIAIALIVVGAMLYATFLLGLAIAVIRRGPSGNNPRRD